MGTNLEALTNTELRELLHTHGFNQPVTSTTRNVLISRLRKRMQEGARGSPIHGTATTTTTTTTRRTASTTSSPAAADLGRYSSAEEESDRESALMMQRQMRKTTGHAPNFSSNMPPPSSTTKRKRPTQQSSYSMFAPHSTSSMSYGGNVPNNNSSNHNLPTIKVPIQSRNSMYIPPPVVHASDTDESDNNAGSNRSGGTAAASSSPNPYLSYGRLHGLSFPKRYTASNLDKSPLISMSRTSSSYANTSRLSDTNNSSSGAEESSSPYVSDFTKRLLQFRDRNLNHDKPENTPVMAAQPNPRYFYRMPNKHSVVQQVAAPPPESGGLFRGLYLRLDQQYGFRQNLVPFVLLGALVLFIAFLVFMYLTISPDLVSTITLANAKYTPCTEDNLVYLLAGENCIFENDLEPALDFLRLIAPELQARVERHLCKDPGLPSVLTTNDAVKMRIDSLLNHDEYDTQRQLINMQYLIEMNPQWHISNLNSDGAPVSVATTQARQLGQVHAFGILKPRLPLTCLFLRKLQTFFFVVGALGLASILAYTGNIAYRRYLRTKQERQLKLNRLISHILQIVMEQAANSPNNPDAAAVVVNHLRDKIVEPAQRTKEMESLWRDAIAFLEHHDSRLQFETGTRNGEDCKLVRWIDTIQLPSPNHRATMGGMSGQGNAPANSLPMGTAGHSPVQQQHFHAIGNLANGRGGAPKPTVANLYNSAQLSKVGETMLTAKKWQSPAFDKTNKISTPPTPCLKIRQMFDKYEAANPNLRTIISDAILEKVGPTCKIYDIFLEPQACCVYVRCATTKDAGMVHDEINGWWFDNRLVSIKFLRLERFMDRFPESLNNRHLLRPSNSEKLSLTQCNRYEDDDDEEVDDDDGELMATGEDELDRV